MSKKINAKFEVPEHLRMQALLKQAELVFEDLNGELSLMKFQKNEASMNRAIN